ncbi:DgyrCDS5826 [Dimorphilus gyrociliatus]|uniref:DgyrCDS5826 n=1 Tax=Dimorphilus gyrociliatus TaxID=2664684 RepID=A0A7I8VNX2_9ANNE|nr:DgyrCDS5826 [Dimorphilus gyrociliatus]
MASVADCISTVAATILGAFMRQRRRTDYNIVNGENGPARTVGRRKSVAAERYDPETDTDETPLTVYPKTDSQRQRLKATLQNCFYFRHLDTEQMEQLIDAMFEKVVEGPEEVIIKEDDDGDYMYVVEKGVFAAFRLSEENGEFKETEPPKIYDNEGFFGELALMYNTPRAVCILSKTAGKLWAMDRQTFRRIVIKSTHLKLKQYEDLLQKVPLFQELTLYERNNVAYALQSKDYLDGEVIIKQDDEADSMYFVEKGAVRCLVKQAHQAEQKEVSRVQPGGYFGELALITDQPRAATVIAVGSTRVAKLPRDDFTRLLGPCKDIMKRNAAAYEEQLAKVFGSKNNVTDLL